MNEPPIPLVRRRWLVGAILVAALCVFASAWLQQESEHDLKCPYWRALIISSSWALSGIGGSIITSIILTALLPGPLIEALRTLQQNSIC